MCTKSVFFLRLFLSYGHKIGVAHKFDKKVIWTTAPVTVQTATGDRTTAYGKVKLNITFPNTIYHHMEYQSI